MTFDELIKQVNYPYQASQGNDQNWFQKQLKKEFALTTSELCEFLGISDQIDSISDD
jgi:hypothetical protein